MVGNEIEVGQGMRDSAVPRSEIFITSKLWNTHQHNVKEGLQYTLRDLGVDYLDLYVRCDIPLKKFSSKIAFSWSTGLFDWSLLVVSIYVSPLRDLTDQQNESSQLLPVNPDGSRSVDMSWNQSDTWRQMEEVYRSGKVRAIGVANWSIPYMEKLRSTWEVVPAVNQVELHPLLPQHDLRAYCHKLGILLEAYSPLGSTGKLDEIFRSNYI